jgi:acid phosphatase family membrane protein YuiD
MLEKQLGNRRARAGVAQRAGRVYLGAHNPLDVVGGAAIGLAITAVLDMALAVARAGGTRRGQATVRH